MCILSIIYENVLRGKKMSLLQKSRKLVNENNELEIRTKGMKNTASSLGQNIAHFPSGKIRSDLVESYFASAKIHMLDSISQQ